MSTTPNSSPKPKPERSFSLTKIRASLRRGSKGPSDTPNGSSPEPSEGRPSTDTAPTTVPTTPGSPTPAGSQRKASSLRRMSLDVVRPNRHGRSGSVSMVPPADAPAAAATSTNGAAPATNGSSTEKGADFDPFSESHDDKSKPRGWRKTMKGALRRTSSRLSTSSAHSAGKPPSIEGKEEAKVAPGLESPPVPSTDSSAKEDESSTASKETPEAVVDAKPAEQVSKEEEEKEADPAVPLEASTSLEWEHVDTKDAEHAPPSVEVTPSVEPEDEDVAEAKTTLPPLNVSSRHLTHLRSELAELSPIIESPITAVRDDAGLMPPVQPATLRTPSPLATSAIEESYVEVPHLNEAAEAAENGDIANAHHRSGGPVVLDVTPATLKPAPASAVSDVTASPALNAIELGNGVEGSDGKKPTPSTPLLANRSTSTSSANNGQQAQSTADPNAQNTVSALGFMSNTAWFVGACVVVGIGMVVGQVRSYRQVQRRSRSAISSYFMTVKRWLRLA